MEIHEQYLQRGWSILRIWKPTAEGVCSCPSGEECEAPGKHPIGPWREFQVKHVHPRVAQNVWFRNPGERNIAVVTGRLSNLVVIDEDALDAAASLKLPPTLTATTHGSRKHYYYQHPYLDSNALAPTQIRLIPHVDFKGDGGYVIAPPSLHASGEVYSWVDPSAEVAPFPSHLLKYIHPVEAKASSPVTPSDWDEIISEGQRSDKLLKLTGSLLGRGLSRDTVFRKMVDHNSTHCRPPLPLSELKSLVFGLAETENEKRSSEVDLQDSIPLQRSGTPPSILEAPAYYGLAGEILRQIDPYMEPCNATILTSLLTAFGNKVGRKPHTIVGPQEHHTNLFTLIFGDSGTSRKGMAWSVIKQLFEDPEPPAIDSSTGKYQINFQPWRPAQGIASGEGMIDMVRDAVPAQGKALPDPGVKDKRKLFYQAEFGTVIHKARGGDAILWQTLRSFFDTGHVENNPKGRPIKATNAHVSIVGNITPTELRKEFPSSERTSGTANRFLWIYAQEGKKLPDGDPIPEDLLKSLQLRINDAVKFAQAVDLMKRDEEATEYWRELYLGELSHDERSPLRDLTSRGKPLILRLSMIYALLDKSKVIKKQHIESALAIWHYSKASIEYLYGDSVSSPLGNRILNYLESRPAKQAIRSELILAVSGYSAKDLDEAIVELTNCSLIEESQTARRPGKKGGPIPVTYRLLKAPGGEKE